MGSTVKTYLLIACNAAYLSAFILAFYLLDKYVERQERRSKKRV